MPNLTVPVATFEHSGNGRNDSMVMCRAADQPSVPPGRLYRWKHQISCPCTLCTCWREDVGTGGCPDRGVSPPLVSPLVPVTPERINKKRINPLSSKNDYGRF